MLRGAKTALTPSPLSLGARWSKMQYFLVPLSLIRERG